MGCCQNRYPPPSAETSQLLVNKLPTESYSNLDPHLLPSEPLFNYLKSGAENFSVSKIFELIPSSKLIFDTKPFPSWTLRPRTVGCLALQYLCKHWKKLANEISEEIIKILPIFIQIISTSTPDKIEQAVLLLNSILIYENDFLKDELVKNRIFHYILPYFSSEKFEFRHVCAILASRIYRRNQIRQKSFIENEGILHIMKVVQSGSFRGKYFCELIQCMIDLIEV